MSSRRRRRFEPHEPGSQPPRTWFGRRATVRPVPELPEVETIRRRLAPLLEGRRFERVEITDPRLTRPHDPFEIARELEGERVTGVDRRAVVKLDDASDVAYRDVRRFGTWLLLEPSEVDGYLESRVGPEPLAASYRARHLAGRLEGRRAPIKAALLDQRTVAGVGNIYADEALWRARVHPLTPAAELTPDELKAIHGAVRAVLQAGIRRQGSTLRDYQLPDGTSGTAQDRFKVYGRTGSPCERCGTPIYKIRVAGRGTWYCPACQVYAASSSSSRPSRSRRQSSV